MASKLLTFNEVVERAATDKTVDDARNTFSKRQAPIRPRAVEPEYVIPSDRELATHLSQGVAGLQEAMDAASKAGLIVEPTFKSVSGRFNEFGVSIDSYICSVEIYRKLTQVAAADAAIRRELRDRKVVSAYVAFERKLDRAQA